MEEPVDGAEALLNLSLLLLVMEVDHLVLLLLLLLSLSLIFVPSKADLLKLRRWNSSLSVQLSFVVQVYVVVNVFMLELVFNTAES